MSRRQRRGGWVGTRQYTPQSIYRSTDGVIALSGGRALTLVIVDANDLAPQWGRAIS